MKKKIAYLSAMLFVLLAYNTLIMQQKSHAQNEEYLLNEAKQGNMYAQYLLGRMYFSGDGAPQNYNEGIKWLHKAAEQGNEVGQAFLGMIYYAGQGTPKNYNEAIKWTHKAAEQGYAEGQMYLGMIYFEGDGGPIDYEEAYFWFNLAAASGAEIKGVTAKEFRNVTAKLLSPDVVINLQKRASEWKPTQTTKTADD